MKRMIVLAAAALAACATGPSRQQFLAGLVGQSETELVRQMGVPSRAYETGGRKFIAYTEQSTDVVPGFAGFYGGGFGGWGYGFGGIGPAVFERSCETTFEVVGERVASWSLRGNAC